MKNEIKDEVRLANIERSIPFLLGFTAVTAAIDAGAYALLYAFNPMGFLVAIPGVLFSFQLLWLLLEPFAIVYDDRVEIIQSFFHRKQFYFNDLVKATTKPGYLLLHYTDEEVEKLNLTGMRKSHLATLQQILDQQIEAKVALRLSL